MDCGQKYLWNPKALHFKKLVSYQLDGCLEIFTMEKHPTDFGSLPWFTKLIGVAPNIPFL